MSLAFRHIAAAAVVAVAWSASVQAQVVYYGAWRPVVAAPVMAAPVAVAPAYVSNYVPAGNYAAVTAFSPPVMTAPAAVAVTSAYAPSVAAPVAVTSYYSPAPAAFGVAAPAVMAPVMAPVAAPVVAAPVYAPGVLYRRGPLGVYRPVRTAYYIPY